MVRLIKVKSHSIYKLFQIGLITIKLSQKESTSTLLKIALCILATSIRYGSGELILIMVEIPKELIKLEIDLKWDPILKLMLFGLGLNILQNNLYCKNKKMINLVCPTFTPKGFINNSPCFRINFSPSFSEKWFKVKL